MHKYLSEPRLRQTTDGLKCIASEPGAVLTLGQALLSPGLSNWFGGTTAEDIQLDKRTD